MDIDGLPAGHELDCLVAEKVMGQKLLSPEKMHAEAERVWAYQSGCRTFLIGFEAVESLNGIIFRNVVPCYSTEIAAAWKVVERLISLGVNLWALGEEEAGGWQADFGRNFNSDTQGFADTAPLAICRAALKTVETLKSRNARSVTPA